MNSLTTFKAGGVAKAAAAGAAKVGVAAKVGGFIASKMVFWKVGLCVMLYGASKALSTVLV